MATTFPKDAPALIIDGSVWYFMEKHGYEWIVYEVQALAGADGDPIEWEQVARLSVKWDECSHIGLANPDMPWAHICGRDALMRTLRMLEWAWGVAFKEASGKD